MTKYHAVGRPEIGPATRVRLPEEMIGRLDEIASQRGTSRAAVIRDIINGYFSHRPFVLRVIDVFDTGSGTTRLTEGDCASLDEAHRKMREALDAAPGIIAEMESDGHEAIAREDYWVATYRIPLDSDGDPVDDIDAWEQIEIAKL